MGKHVAYCESVVVCSKRTDSALKPVLTVSAES